MPEKPAAEKTEQPTPKRLEKARQKGNVPQSQELASAVTLIVLVVMVALMAPALLKWFVMQMEEGFSCKESVFANSGSFINFINTKIVETVSVIWPILAVLFAGAIAAGVSVSGFNFAPSAIELKTSAINPSAGLSKLFDAKSLVRLLTSILKLFFVSLIVWLYLQSRLDAFANLRWAWSAELMAGIGKIILGLMIRVVIALLVIAVAETFYQKWKYIQDLKMTRQEVKQERKDLEGSPEVKGRIRKIQIEMAMRRMLQEVPKASVVLVNPTEVAVALRYEAKTMDAPIVVAKGADHLAEKIREIARAYGVPIVRRPELARTIYATVEPGGIIPESLYVAVAEVLAMIYRLRRRNS